MPDFRIRLQNASLFAQTGIHKGIYELVDVYEQRDGGASYRYTYSFYTTSGLFTDFEQSAIARAEWRKVIPKESSRPRIIQGRPSLFPKKMNKLSKGRLTREEKVKSLDLNLLHRRRLESKGAANLYNTVKGYALDIYKDCSSASEFKKRVGDCPTTWMDDFARITGKKIHASRNSRPKKSSGLTFSDFLG